MSDLSSYAQARSIRTMHEAVPKLQQINSARTIPLLARFDRLAPGWLRVLLFGLVRQLFLFALLGFLLTTLLGIAHYFFTTTSRFVAQQFDSRNWQILTLGLATLFAMLSPAFKKQVIVTKELIPVAIPNFLQPTILRLSQLIVICVMGLSLFITFMPSSFGLIWGIQWLRFNPSYLRAFEIEGSIERGRWLVIVAGLFLLFCVIRLVITLWRRELKWLMWILFMLWGVGVWYGFISAEISQWLTIPAVVIMTPENLYDLIRRWSLPPMVLIEFYPDLIFSYWAWLVALLFYPSGLAAFVVKLLLNLAFQTVTILRQSWQKLALRYSIGQALRHQRQRNHNIINGAAWSTVCSEHLHRFQLQTERLRYGRWLSYACCPTCNDDVSGIANITSRTLRLDRFMSEPRQHSGSSLHLNGLQWLETAQESPAPLADAVVIGQVEPFDVEAFIVAYSGSKQEKPLNSLHGCLEAEKTLDIGSDTLLRDALKDLRTDYQLEDVACSPQTIGRLQNDERFLRAKIVVGQLTRSITGFIFRLAIVAAIVIWGLIQIA